jgi:molecular chaperone GrpE
MSKNKENEELNDAVNQEDSATSENESVEYIEELEELRQSVEALEQENEELQLQLEQKTDLALRKVAEFENLKRRTQKERLQLFDDAKIEALQQFLPIYDDLERTLESIKDQDKNPFIEGVELIRNKYKNVIEQYGVERIDQTGIPFDVNFHDALMRQPADENVESNIVVQVLESGYKMGDKIIRHAKVIVSE